MLENAWKRLEGGGPLVARIALGTCMVAHGYGKVLDLRKFIRSVDNLGIPYPEVLAPAAAFSEFLGGALLVLGLFTRPAAASVMATMAVAVVAVHWENGYWNKNKGFEFPLTLALLALSVLLSGAGPVSLDRSVRKVK